jgi:predicted acylesterase/phospholipase RssA
LTTGGRREQCLYHLSIGAALRLNSLSPSLLLGRSITSPMDETIFFKSCLGVFQGGGCRAAAFAGAYEEAVRRGVSFSEVAGTSAGSIVAALIGGGATPSFIKEKLAKLDFKSLVKEPERTKRPFFSPVKLLAFKDKRYVDLYFDQGFYSSKAIQPWVEALLAELLPTEHRPISFKSLPFPTYLVSTDLARYQAKVWSQGTTPDELVSEAVRASCSIPIFFQPVERRYRGTGPYDPAAPATSARSSRPDGRTSLGVDSCLLTGAFLAIFRRSFLPIEEQTDSRYRARYWPFRCTAMTITQSPPGIRTIIC